MTETIVAVYEGGIFKPLWKVAFPEHKRMRLVVLPEEDGELLELQKKELSSIISIGRVASARSHADMTSTSMRTEVFAFDEHFKQYGSFIVSPLMSSRFRSRAGVGNGDQ